MKRKTKVLHVIGGGEFGGAEQYLVTLLKNIDRNEFEAEVACLFTAPLAGRLAKENISHRVFPMQSKLDFGVIAKLASYIKDNGFDIIHTHGVRANLVGRLAARKAKVKNIVTTVHSVLEFDYPKKADLLINRLTEKVTGRLTKHFIAVSEDLAQYVREAYKVSKRKVTVIHNGLEMAPYRETGSGGRVRKELGIPEQDMVLGVVSRLHPVKGHMILFYAFQQLIREFPFLKLVLVGTGPLEEQLRQEAASLGIARHTIFTGFRKDIPKLLQSFDIVVQPSLSEGFGLTVIEAMAAGKPVVASGVGGLKEIIKDRENGLLVTPGDPVALAEAITSMLELPGRTKELARAGKATVERYFSAGNMTRKTEEVYRNMCRRQARKRQKEQSKLRGNKS